MFARLLRGTLCVESNGIRRFFTPTLLERLYLLWIFRNFHHLPLNVLGPKDRACIERVCARPGVGGDPDLVVGVVECEMVPPKKAAQAASLFHPQAASAKRASR